MIYHTVMDTCYKLQYIYKNLDINVPCIEFSFDQFVFFNTAELFMKTRILEAFSGVKGFIVCE